MDVKAELVKVFEQLEENTQNASHLADSLNLCTVTRLDDDEDFGAFTEFTQFLQASVNNLTVFQMMLCHYQTQPFHFASKIEATALVGCVVTKDLAQ